MADNHLIKQADGTEATFRSTETGLVKTPHVIDETNALINAKIPDLESGYTPSLSKGKNVSFWPGYSGTEQGFQSIGIDPDGATSVRGAVLTDEGTFRVNFANAGLNVSIGAVTISGNVVTGSGFLNSDVHYYDYFKLAADGESAWVQVDRVVSDTQIILVSNYVGGSSGTGERSLLRPVTGSGGSLAVSSGQLTIGSGTTNAAITGVGRFVDYAPMIFRSRLSLSQRIANQDIYAGFRENAATPRYFARFRFNGTTNTTVICETGRNPTGAPSASETETTTFTIPGGITSATLAEYRIELLTELVRFYVNNTLVATHTRVLPHQHDEMFAAIEVVNATGAGSNTNVIVDYVTGKNHNKVEVGILSNDEQVISLPPNLDQFFYNQSGVIAINTDLLVIDCSRYKSLLIQCTSMGTTGVVTPQWTNDPALATGNRVTATLFDQAGASSTTFNAAALRKVNVEARYFILRLTTATTGGTTTIYVNGCAVRHQMFLATQPVSGTINPSGGALAAGTNAIGDVGIQYRANATGAATPTNVNSPATPVAQQIKSGAGRITGIFLHNNAASTRWLKFFNALSASVTPGTTAANFEIGLSPGQTFEFSSEGGLGFATGFTIMITGGQGLTNNTGITLGDVTGFTAHA